MRGTVGIRSRKTYFMWRGERRAAMNDLISRQAAIRWVKTECNPYGKPTLEFESGKKVIEHLEQMPSVQSEWIPCSERLPEEAEDTYWVCTDGGYQCQCRWTNDVFGLGVGDTWTWKIFDIPQYSKVIAWMPLPEPYKEDKS